nr:MAG TPA: hypothetical protein [Caudoviricetes sp.]
MCYNLPASLIGCVNLVCRLAGCPTARRGIFIIISYLDDSEKKESLNPYLGKRCRALS